MKNIRITNPARATEMQYSLTIEKIGVIVENIEILQRYNKLPTVKVVIFLLEIQMLEGSLHDLLNSLANELKKKNSKIKFVGGRKNSNGFYYLMTLGQLKVELNKYQADFL